MHLLVLPVQAVSTMASTLPSSVSAVVSAVSPLPLPAKAVCIGGSGKILLQAGAEVAFAADDNLVLIWRS